MHRTDRLGGIGRATAALAVVVTAGAGWATPAAADPVGIETAATTSTPASFDRTINTPCPAGKVVTGGGAYLTLSTAAQGHVGLDRHEPRANGRGFTAGMREAGAADYTDDWQMTTLAVCAPQPTGYQVVATTGAAGTEYVTASCGTKSVIGVGARVNSGFGNVLLDQVVPSADLKSVTARAVVVQGGAAAGWSLTTFAVCASAPAGLERISLAPAYASDSHQLTITSCPDGKALYSAGADIGAGNGQVLLSGVNMTAGDTVRVWADEDADGTAGTWNLVAYGICGS
ncbi:MAG TPA: hypothetical protein VGD43_13210 [Micromonospora sp.]